MNIFQVAAPIEFVSHLPNEVELHIKQGRDFKWMAWTIQASKWGPVHNDIEGIYQTSLEAYQAAQKVLR